MISFELDYYISDRRSLMARNCIKKDLKSIPLMATEKLESEYVCGLKSSQ